MGTSSPVSSAAPPTRCFPAAPSDPHVVVVGFDRKTIATPGLGNPLPRDKVAELVDQLKADGARVIGFDVTYSQENQEQVAPDAILAKSITNAGNVVLAVKGTSGKQDHGVVKLDNVSGLAAGLQGADFTVGHAQTNQDPTDGVNRSLPLVVESADGTFIPSLSLAAVMRYRGIKGPPIVRPDGVQIGDRFVPTIGAKSLLLNFAERLSDPARVISAADVIAGTVPKKKIDGKIVLVGAVDSTLGDNRQAPVNKSTGIPGVLLHANAVNTMLTGTYLNPVSDSQTLLWVAAMTALIGTAVLLLPLWMSVLFTMLVGAGYIVYAFTRFNSGHVLNFVYPSLAVIVAFIGALALRYFGETRQRRRVTALFSQYVPEAVAQRLVDEDRASVAVEGERLDMTVLFCDLRGFTALSESLSPATVRVMLNHYYDRVTDVVLVDARHAHEVRGRRGVRGLGCTPPEHRPPTDGAPVRHRDPGAHARAQPGAAGAGRARGVVRHRAQHRGSGGGPLRRRAPPPVRRRRRHRQRRCTALLGRGPG